ncbi:MAG: hypothetical protein ACFFED_15720 [Candidatus Thorarchaeota archaeon]
MEEVKGIAKCPKCGKSQICLYWATLGVTTAKLAKPLDPSLGKIAEIATRTQCYECTTDTLGAIPYEFVVNVPTQEKVHPEFLASMPAHDDDRATPFTARKMSPTEKLFLKMKSQSILTGYEDSKKIASIMFTVVPLVVTVYTALANWLVPSLQPPFPSEFYIIPAIFFVATLIISIFISKPDLLVSSPDTPDKIRDNYEKIVRKRYRWSQIAIFVFSIGIILMFIILLYGTAFGVSRES